MRPRLGLLYITTTIGVGMILLTFITKYLQNWQYAQFTISSFCLVIAFLTRCLSESPRWLYSQDRTEQARNVIRKIGRWDKIHITDKDFEDFEKQMVILKSFLTLFLNILMSTISFKKSKE